MSETGLHRLFNRARMDDRLVNELIGLAHGIIADGAVNQAEAEYLFKWIVANAEQADNPVLNLLYGRVEKVLADGVLYPEEAGDLLRRSCARRAHAPRRHSGLPSESCSTTFQRRSAVTISGTADTSLSKSKLL